MDDLAGNVRSYSAPVPAFAAVTSDQMLTGLVNSQPVDPSTCTSKLTIVGDQVELCIAS